MDDDKAVTELTGMESGVWRVWTRGSSHRIDLDLMTVERIPGPGRPATVNDRPRPIRVLNACTVGYAGRWSMESDDPDVEFFWHITSTIRLIEPEPAELTGEEDWLTTEPELNDLGTSQPE